MSFIKRIVNGFLTCFAMYTCIPMPFCSWEDDNLRYMFCFFPLTGVLIGLAGFLWFVLAGMLELGTVFKAAVYVCIPVMVSGGIHMDGFLDTADAFSSWRSRDERLRILKDPHLGAFAVIWAAVYFVLYLGEASEITSDSLPFFCMVFVLSRIMVIFGILSMPAANPEGTVAAFYQRAGKKTLLAVNCIWLLLLSVAIWFIRPVMLTIPAVEAVWFFVFKKMAVDNFGGISGDLAGFFISVSELMLHIVIVLLMRG